VIRYGIQKATGETMVCPNCGKSDLYPKQESVGMSVNGIIAAVLFLVGIGLLVSGGVFGLILIVFALLLGIFGREKKTVLLCPVCKHSIEL
jgi:hypothetical protein